MPISIGCQGCGKLLRIKDELAGKRIKCPKCALVQVVPLEAAPEPSPAPPSPALPREVALKTVEALAAQEADRTKRSRVLLLFTLAGALYGLGSAFGNQNPYYSWFAPSARSFQLLEMGWEWKPSPLWLPSYALCQLGFGAQYDRAAGYHFKSPGGWIAFYEASALLGALGGAAVGICAITLLWLRGHTGPPVRVRSWAPRDCLVVLGWGVLSLVSGYLCAAVGAGLASIGGRTGNQEPGRVLPIAFNSLLVGLVLPHVIRRMRNDLARQDTPAGTWEVLAPARLHGPPAPAPSRKRRWVVAAAAAVGLTGLLVATLVWLFWSGPSGPLPGAAGPPVVELATPPLPIQVERIFLTTQRPSFQGAASPKEWKRTLPSGTSDVYVGIVFRGHPPNGTKIDVKVFSSSGAVPLPEGRTVYTVTNAQGATIILPCSPVGGGFPDGPYQCKVLVNRTAVALLNWSVGPG